MSWNNPGARDAEIYKDGFHERLSRFWPGPREQLHSGGWEKTREMVADIKRLMQAGSGSNGISRVLDLCSGEGATAVHLAAREGWEVTGVELVESAVMVARARAQQYGTVVRVKLVEAVDASVTAPAADRSPAKDAVAFHVSYDTSLGLKMVTNSEDDESSSSSSAVRCELSYKTAVGGKVTPLQDRPTCANGTAAAAPTVRLHLSYQSVEDLVRFAHASVHYMPLPSNSYDVVYGQDPDGLANEDRIFAFKEVLRVLRPGGLLYFWHHWVPGPGWGPDLLREYWSDPFTGSPRLSYECYLEDLKASGLQLLSVTDTTRLSLHHFEAMADRMRREVAAVAAAAAVGPWTPPSPSDGSLPDKWLERSLQFAKRGGTMGIQIAAVKPRKEET